MWQAAGEARSDPVCHDLDEVKDYHDQAVALAEHKRQANDEEARRQFNEIRLRENGAWARWRRRGRGGDQRSDRRSRRATGGGKTLRELGITKSESSLSQQLAQVPDAVFEERLKKPKPTTSSIIEPDKATQRAWERQQAKL